MPWPAKFFQTDSSIETLIESLNVYAKGYLSEATDDMAAKGFKGMDFYFSFLLRGVTCVVMVNQDTQSGQLSVVVFAVPTLIQGTKAREIVSGVVDAVPHARSTSFPDGPRAGHLLFI
jgi:hypothetical protein